MTTMSVVGECFFWYLLTRVVADKFHRAVKRLCVCVCSRISNVLVCHWCYSMPVVILPPGGVQSIVMSMSVCLSVNSCNSKTTRQTLPNSLRMLPVAMAWSFFDGVAIRYAFPVLSITSCFHAIGPVGRIKHNVMFRRSSSGCGASWTSDNHSVRTSSSECGTEGEICFLCLSCLWIEISQAVNVDVINAAVQPM